jgi:glutamine---fructose-6-phosphate transaminase (isomerizing)
MCSVVGYIGKSSSRSVVLEGLTRLEYRGYDSAGFACLNVHDRRLMYAKAEGGLINLVDSLEKSPIDGTLGIGHTRWSTHGVASQRNAHPQFDCEKTISIVHNGIIENHHALRARLLAAGHIFHSDTDTEVIAHLFEVLVLSHKTFKSALLDLVNQLEGAYAFIMIMQEFPDQMVVVRKRSPLCVGIGDDEMFVASDVLAFAEKTKKVLFLPDASIVVLKADMLEMYNFAGTHLPIRVQEIDVDWTTHEKKGYEHYMLKEIYEQRDVIRSTITFLRSISHRIADHIGITEQQLKDLNTINIIGAGTSWHAGCIGQFFFESICMMPTRVSLASEFRYTTFFPEQRSLYVAISQSGETADTLEALRFINDMALPSMVITNVSSSSMVREAGGFLLTQAGHEIAVASTKAFSTQLTVLYWLAHRIAVEKGIITKYELERAEEELFVAAEIMENSIENYKLDIIKSLGTHYSQYKKAIFLGRHIGYPLALEAALKLKEISYIFTQGYPAGELKHGPLALIDHELPVFLFSHQDQLIYQKLLSNAQEVKARGARLTVFAFEGQDELIKLAEHSFIFPHLNQLLGPLAMTGLMQFLSYQIAKELKCPIDKPRNLAKSVTVE